MKPQNLTLLIALLLATSFTSLVEVPLPARARDGYMSRPLGSNLGTKLGSYTQELRTKVYTRWDSLPHRERHPIVVSFGVRSDGSITDVGVDQSAASHKETALAAEVIASVAPFGPLPKGLSGPLQVTLPFNVDQQRLSQLSELNMQAAQLAGPLLFERNRANHDPKQSLSSQLLEQCKQAQTVYEQALSLSETIYGDSFPQTMYELEKLVPLYKDAHDWDKASVALRRLIKYYETHQRHASLAWARWSLGEVYAAQGDTKKAAPSFEQAITLREVHGLDSNSPTTYQNRLGDYYASVGLFDMAERTYKKAVDRIQWDSHFGLEDVYSGIDSLDRLAKFYFERGRYRESEELYKKELAVYEGFKKPFSFTSDFQWFSPYLQILRKAGRAAEAEEIEQKVAALKVLSGSFHVGLTPLFKTAD